MLTSLTGTASKGSQASRLPAAAPAPMATVAGAVILGTAIVLSPALASCSARDCAYYGNPDANTTLCRDQRADHRRWPVKMRSA
jgi:hypothetical protein